MPAAKPEDDETNPNDASRSANEVDCSMQAFYPLRLPLTVGFWLDFRCDFCLSQG